MQANLKTKLKTKSFWMSVVAAVILILQNAGIKVDVPYVNQIMESICALALLLGVFTAPTKSGKQATSDKAPNSNEDAPLNEEALLSEETELNEEILASEEAMMNENMPFNSGGTDHMS